MKLMDVRELYDADFFEWTQRNAALLRAGRLDQIDIQHVAEELEDMGKRDKRQLENRLEVLLVHLLKWKVQRRESRSWRSTIGTQRRRMQKLLSEMPSLGPRIADQLPEVYSDAVRSTIEQTGLPNSCFPERCPFTVEEILDQDFLP